MRKHLIGYAIILLLFLWLLTPNAVIMHAVNAYMTYGDSQTKDYYYNPTKLTWLLLTRKGACGEYSALLAYALTLKLQDTAIIDLLTCDHPPCGHTIAYANGVYYDTLNDKEYTDTSFYPHAYEWRTSLLAYETKSVNGSTPPPIPYNNLTPLQLALTALAWIASAAAIVMGVLYLKGKLNKQQTP